MDTVSFHTERHLFKNIGKNPFIFVYVIKQDLLSTTKYEQYNIYGKKYSLIFIIKSCL